MKGMLGLFCIHITHTEKKECVNPSIGQQLQDLEQARQQGLISAEEFGVLKQRIVQGPANGLDGTME